jgi:hydrogenase maturation protease
LRQSFISNNQQLPGRSLVIASGNTLRRDDGVAHYTLNLLDGVEKRAELQLNPELSEDIARFDQVIFLDADCGRGDPSVIPIEASQNGTPFTHKSTAEEIVRLARSLYGFTGTAWVCRIPVQDFGYGEGLSAGARDAARRAAALVENVLM